MTSTTVPSIQERIKEKRIKLIKNGIVKEREGDHIFVKDQIFSSPSLAASVIMGSSINGWERWETSNGVKLKKYKNNNDKNINTNTSKINNIKKQKKDYTGMPLKAFVFKNKEIQIHNWIDLLKNLCVKISELHKDDFEKITNLKGRKRRYFSYDKEKLFRASSKDINKTGIYYETNLSTNQIVKIYEDILEMFDYKRDELKLITED